MESIQIMEEEVYFLVPNSDMRDSVICGKESKNYIWGSKQLRVVSGLEITDHMQQEVKTLH